jgi:hypothetical protein
MQENVNSMIFMCIFIGMRLVATENDINSTI